MTHSFVKAAPTPGCSSARMACWKWRPPVAHEVKDPKAPERLKDREQLNAALMNASVSELTAASEADGSLVTSAGLDPLLRALNAVARFQGVVLRNAALDLHGRDPLWAIAEASGLRIRKVRLQGKWWERE